MEGCDELEEEEEDMEDFGGFAVDRFVADGENGRKSYFISFETLSFPQST